MFCSSFSGRVPKRHAKILSRFGQLEILLNLNWSAGTSAGLILNLKGSPAFRRLYKLIMCFSAKMELPSTIFPIVGQCPNSDVSGNSMIFSVRILMPFSPTLRCCCSSSFAALMNSLHSISASKVGKNSGKYALLANGSSGNSFVRRLFFHKSSYWLIRAFVLLLLFSSRTSCVCVIGVGDGVGATGAAGTGEDGGIRVSFSSETSSTIFFAFSNSSKCASLALRYSSPNLFTWSKLDASEFSRNFRMASPYLVSNSINLFNVSVSAPRHSSICASFSSPRRVIRSYTVLLRSSKRLIFSSSPFVVIGDSSSFSFSLLPS